MQTKSESAYFEVNVGLLFVKTNAYTLKFLFQQSTLDILFGSI